MQLSSLTFLGVLQLIFFLAEIVFFLFLILRFKSWHIKVLQEKSNLKKPLNAKEDFDDFDDFSTSNSFENKGFDKDLAQDLIDANAASILAQRSKVKSTEDNSFLDKQEKFLASLAGMLGLKFAQPSFDTFANSSINNASNSAEDFAKVEPVTDNKETDFDNLSDDLSEEDFSDFESAENIGEEDFDGFDDFDSIDDFDETRIEKSEEKQEQAKELKRTDINKETEDKPTAKASTEVDDFNDDRLQESLDDLDEFDFSDFEAELFKD